MVGCEIIITFTPMEEKWKQVPGYEGFYKVSTMGRVISMNRTITHTDGTIAIYKGQLRKDHPNTDGYPQLNLNKVGVKKTFTVHKLMAITFLGKVDDDRLVVDHINNIKDDNRLENLRLTTNRINVSKDKKNKTSQYTGVHWFERDQGWRAKIRVNNEQIYIGLFKNEYDAHLAYQAEMEKIQSGTIEPPPGSHYSEKLQ